VIDDDCAMTDVEDDARLDVCAGRAHAGHRAEHRSVAGQEVGGASEEVGAVMLEHLLQRGDQIEGAAEEDAVDLL